MPHSSENRSYDAVVVGAGVIGLSCAWRAAEAGLSVCVLDRSEPGAGASGVAAGMLAPIGEASWGEERLLALNLESAQAWPGFAEAVSDASGSQVPYRRCGAIHVALDRDEVEELRRRHQLHDAHHLEAEWLRPSACRALEPGLSTACAAGVHAREEAEVDPRSLLDALRAAFEHSGGSLVCGVEVSSLLVDGNRVSGVSTVDGRRFGSDQVVVATGAGTGNASWLPGEARPPVRPVKGQILFLRSVDGSSPCQRIVATNWVYIVPRGNGRVVVGATVEERSDLTLTAGGVHELLREAYRVLPEVAELELVEALVGLRPGTPDNSPLIGRGALDGLILATGHFRNGILLAPVTADGVARLLVGKEPEGPVAAMAPARLDGRIAASAGPLMEEVGTS